MNVFVVSSEAKTSLDALLTKISRDSSTPLRSARNDKAAGGIHRGVESGKERFVMSTEVETSPVSAPQLARDSSTSLGMTER